MMDMNDFRTYAWGGRPVLSVDKDRWRLRWMAAQQYPAYTWRRKAFKSVLRFSLLFGMDSLLGTDAQVPEWLGMDAKKVLTHIAHLLGENRVHTVFAFPAQPDRGRVYATFFNAARQPIGFAKIALIDGSPELLETEGRALEKIGALPGRTYHVPKLIALETTDNYRLLLMQSLPASARPYPGRDEAVLNFKVHAGRRYVQPQEFRTLSWWSGLQAELTEKHDAFSNALQRYGRQGLNVGWAHGDLGPGNMMISGDELWIYDWEQSQPDAPHSTDTIGFFLGCRTRRIFAAPRHVLSEFSRRFLSGRSEEERGDVVFSLAYRLAYGGDDIRYLLQHWQA